VYNYRLNLKISAYQNENIRLSKFDLDKQLTELKKLDEYNWLKEVNSQSLQASNRHLDVAFSNFFKQHNDFPKFKSKKTNRFSFEIPANIYIDIDNNKVSFPKFKEGVNLVISRKPKGVIRQATVSKTPTNKYFLTILYETGVDNKQKEIITRENSVGIDLGIKDFVITSDGVKYENNKYLRKLEDKLAKEQIKLSIKVVNTLGELEVIIISISPELSAPRRYDPTISIFPSVPFGAAQTFHWYSVSISGLYCFPVNSAAVALSFSKSSKYFKNNTQEVCST
jgi:putative transposase